MGEVFTVSERTTTFRRGDRVRLTEATKVSWRARGDGAHVDEFGGCTGLVEGPMFPGTGAPEIDVRWQPSGLRYGYDPAELEVVSDPTAHACEIVVSLNANEAGQLYDVLCGKPASLYERPSWICLDCSVEMLREGGNLSAEGTQALFGLLKAAGQEAVERASKATEGPWYDQGGYRVLQGGPHGVPVLEAKYCEGSTGEDTAFAANARTSNPLLGAGILALVAEVERLTALEESMRVAFVGAQMEANELQQRLLLLKQG